jgi:hypothetical protein
MKRPSVTEYLRTVNQPVLGTAWGDQCNRHGCKGFLFPDLKVNPLLKKNFCKSCGWNGGEHV